MSFSGIKSRSSGPLPELRTFCCEPCHCVFSDALTPHRHCRAGDAARSSGQRSSGRDALASLPRGRFTRPRPPSSPHPPSGTPVSPTIWRLVARRNYGDVTIPTFPCDQDARLPTSSPLRSRRRSRHTLPGQRTIDSAHLRQSTGPKEIARPHRASKGKRAAGKRRTTSGTSPTAARQPPAEISLTYERRAQELRRSKSIQARPRPIAAPTVDPQPSARVRTWSNSILPVPARPDPRPLRHALAPNGRSSAASLGDGLPQGRRTPQGANPADSPERRGPPTPSPPLGPRTRAGARGRQSGFKLARVRAATSRADRAGAAGARPDGARTRMARRMGDAHPGKSIRGRMSSRTSTDNGSGPIPGMLTDLANSELKLTAPYFSHIVTPPCSLRAPPEAVRWRSRVWRPGFCVHATQGSGSSRITARARRKTGAALQWLDADGLKGGANARLDRARLCSPARARKSGPRRETPQVERRIGARAGHTARWHLQGAQVTQRHRRSAPSGG